MAKASSSRRVEAALSMLTLRATRNVLYDRLVDDIDGVDATTYPLLSGLARFGPMSATRLAEALGFDRTVTTRYASRLEAAGLLERSDDATDRRATVLLLTPAGRAAAGIARRRLTATIDEVLGGWTKREGERFAVALEKFAAGVQAPRRRR
jgi:DNA-binding MarR family transcriptional regulator